MGTIEAVFLFDAQLHFYFEREPPGDSGRNAILGLKVISTDLAL